MLVQEDVLLRPLELTDLDFLFNFENDKLIRRNTVSENSFSKKELREYIHNAKQDILIANQFRFVIDVKGVPVGCIDLFDYDLLNSQSYIGIGILKKYRGSGFAKKALYSLIRYAFGELGIDKLYATILPVNKSSIALFCSVGFIHRNKNIYSLNK